MRVAWLSIFTRGCRLSGILSEFLEPVAAAHATLAAISSLEVVALEGSFAVPGHHAARFATHPAFRCYITHTASVADARLALSGRPWVRVFPGCARRSGLLPDSGDLLDTSRRGGFSFVLMKSPFFRRVATFFFHLTRSSRLIESPDSQEIQPAKHE